MKRWIALFLLVPILLSAQGAPLRVENTVLLGVVPAPAKNGLWVIHVLAKSPAAKAGMRPGDRLLELNGKKVTRPGDVDALLQGVNPGQAVTLKIQRKKKTAILKVPVIARRAYKGDFLKPTATGKTGHKAAEWYVYDWANVGKDGKGPSRANTKGKVVVIHTFQSW